MTGRTLNGVLYPDGWPLSPVVGFQVQQAPRRLERIANQRLTVTWSPERDKIRERNVGGRVLFPAAYGDTRPPIHIADRSPGRLEDAA